MKSKKILVINLDVGSAVEYAGNIVFDILKKHISDNNLDYELQRYSSQNPVYLTFQSIYNYKPDVIILNELHKRTLLAVLCYKAINQDCNIIFMNHDWGRFYNKLEKNEYTESDDGEFKHFITQYVNATIVLNYKPDGKFPDDIINVYNLYPPLSPNEWNIFIPWKQRSNNFLYIGHIYHDKLSSEFLKELKKTDLKLDVYGDIVSKDNEYLNLFNNHKNINYKKSVSQDMVPTILNKYKYFVMPHDGPEMFNWTLMQAIMCGTIPLITNLNARVNQGFNWIDWAKGLYFENKNASDLIKTLSIIDSENIDFSEKSHKISNEIIKKFDYNMFVSIFINKVFEDK